MHDVMAPAAPIVGPRSWLPLSPCQDITRVRVGDHNPSRFQGVEVNEEEQGDSDC